MVEAAPKGTSLSLPDASEEQRDGNTSRLLPFPFSTLDAGSLANLQRSEGHLLSGSDSSRGPHEGGWDHHTHGKLTRNVLVDR